MNEFLFDAFTWLLALTFTFGGLLVWPIYRRVRPDHLRRSRGLKTVFLLHIGLGGLGIAYVAYAILTGQPDAHMTPTLVYLIGTMSLAASFAVIVGGALGAMFRG